MPSLWIWLAPSRLPKSDGHHLQDARLVGPAEVGVRLDPVEQDDPVGLVGVPVEVDREADRVGPEDHRVHLGPDFHAHLGFGDPVAGQELALAFGGRAAVAAHRGDDEGPEAEFLEGIDRGPGDDRNRGDPPAPHPDGDRPARRDTPADPALQDQSTDRPGNVRDLGLRDRLPDPRHRWKRHPTSTPVRTSLWHSRVRQLIDYPGIETTERTDQNASGLNRVRSSGVKRGRLATRPEARGDRRRSTGHTSARPGLYGIREGVVPIGRTISVSRGDEARSPEPDAEFAREDAGRGIAVAVPAHRMARRTPCKSEGCRSWPRPNSSRKPRAARCSRSSGGASKAHRWSSGLSPSNGKDAAENQADREDHQKATHRVPPRSKVDRPWTRGHRSLRARRRSFNHDDYKRSETLAVANRRRERAGTSPRPSADPDRPTRMDQRNGRPMPRNGLKPLPLGRPYP